MFNLSSIAAMSTAQFRSAYDLVAEAEGRGLTVDGLLIENPTHQVAAVVLVIDDQPQSGSEDWHRAYDFDTGVEIARGEDAFQLGVEGLATSLEELLTTASATLGGTEDEPQPFDFDLDPAA